ncbi:MAG: hypothetical protein KGI08_06990 [Thaumarchaeota archaeon]|nr:hypothetical protein [Nitrososphaerota archaeon]
MGLKEVATGRSDVFRVHPSILSEKEGWNVRDYSSAANEAHIEQIAQATFYSGTEGFPPIIIWTEGENYYISDGHCRWRGFMRAIARGADIKSCLVMTEGRGTNESDRKFSQIGRNSGKPLEPGELSEAVKGLLSFGWSVEDIAKKSGRSIPAINAIIDLLETPPSVQKLVASGRISQTQALATVRARGNEEGARTLEAAVNHAADEGKDRATAKDVAAVTAPTGAPVGVVRQSASHKLAMLKELFEATGENEIEFDDEDAAEGWRCIRMKSTVWKKIADILDV